MKSFASLFAKGKKYIYNKKDIITSPSLSLKGIYYVKEGFLYGYSLTSNNKKMIQTILKPGDIFPLLQYFESTIHIPTRFYTKALTEVTLLELDKDLFFTKVYSDRNLMKELIQAFTSYLRKYVERVENLERETLSERVTGRLLHFASDFAVAREKTLFIEVPLTHEFIAESINVSRENVSRELNKLEKEKVIEFQGKHLIILDIGKLKKKK